LQGGIDSAIGAGRLTRELAYSAIDIPIGLADIGSTLAFGESLGAPLSQLSRAGSNPDSLVEVIADAGSRNVLTGLTFGGFAIVDASIEYSKTGDVRQFSRSVGGQGVLNLVVAGTAKGFNAVRAGSLVADTRSCPISAEVVSAELGPQAEILLQRLATQVPTRTSPTYSVAFETQLRPTSYPGFSRGFHFQEANENLLSVIQADPRLAQIMQEVGVNLGRTPTGLAPRTSPGGWSWHNATEPGVLQLVPRSQHTPSSTFWYTMHPDGQGGYAKWGR
jgi:hypothetical protein